MKATIGSKRFLGLTLAAALVLAALFSPAATAYICCGFTTHFAYYSDPAHTQFVGSCTDNLYCTDQNSCSGKVTAYYTTNSYCCRIECGN